MRHRGAGARAGGGGRPTGGVPFLLRTRRSPSGRCPHRRRAAGRGVSAIAHTSGGWVRTRWSAAGAAGLRFILIGIALFVLVALFGPVIWGKNPDTVSLTNVLHSP